jgi:hypothetical protein
VPHSRDDDAAEVWRLRRRIHKLAATVRALRLRVRDLEAAPGERRAAYLLAASVILAICAIVALALPYIIR